MNRKAITLLFAITICVAACDKPAPEAPAETAEAPAAEANTAEAPEKAPETAGHHGHDGHDHAAAPKGELPADIVDGETKYFGDRFTVIEAPTTIAKAMETAKDHAGPYKVEATIEKVCKKKGCWFTMKDESVEEPVRVTMKDYGFFVPRNADGTRAVVEGTLASREMPQDEAQHYAEDEAAAGEEPRKVEGPQQVWEFTATAIEISKGEG